MKANKKKISFIISSIIVLILFVYIVLLFISPSSILSRLHFSFNSPEKVDALVFKQIKALILFSLFVLSIFWFYHTVFFKKLYSAMQSLMVYLSEFLNSNLLLLISIIYLILLYFIAVSHYDLGFDEAWYIHWSKNFSSTGIAFYKTDGIISIIDTITMLPFYLLSVIWFRLGLSEVWQFKLLSSILSLFALLVMYAYLKKVSGKSIAVLSIVFLILQPGFGFISSSYFGEFFQVVFLFSGLYWWLDKNDNFSDKRLLLSGFLFSVAIHTKFQLLIILIASFLIFDLLENNYRTKKVLFYTILFTVVIGVLRVLPVLLTDPKQIRYLLIMDWLSGNSISQSLSVTAFDKIQLFNRFFPLPVFGIIVFCSLFYIKKPFEKFILIFSVTAVLWWIFLFPYTTYRHPFIGIITLCIIAGMLSVRMFDSLIRLKKFSVYKIKYVSAIVLAFIMLYGFSANLIYAYIGYNDGVQFDMDGFKNRLFSNIEFDNSQKEFYSQLKNIVSTQDTLYNGSFVTRFYMDNPVSSFNAFKNSYYANLYYNQPEKFLLVTRENYPLGFQNIYHELDSLGFQKRLILKVGNNELYKIKK